MTATHEGEDHKAGDFTEEEGKIHQAGFKIIMDGMSLGLGFDEACAGLEVVDPGLREVIIDDYLKITIAEKHFQGKEPLETVAASMKIPVERVQAVKESMLREVQQASLDVYRKQSSESGFSMESVGGEERKEKDS